MPPLNLKWHNYSLAIRIKLSPDTKVLIFVLCVFALLGLGTVSKSIDAKFDAAVLALALGLGVGLYKDYKADKLDVDVAEKNLGQRVTDIKNAAAGKPTCEDPGAGAKNG